MLSPYPCSSAVHPRNRRPRLLTGHTLLDVGGGPLGLLRRDELVDMGSDTADLPGLT